MKKVSLSGHPKANVSRLRHPSALEHSPAAVLCLQCCDSGVEHLHVIQCKKGLWKLIWKKFGTVAQKVSAVYFIQLVNLMFLPIAKLRHVKWQQGCKIHVQEAKRSDQSVKLDVNRSVIKNWQFIASLVLANWRPMDTYKLSYEQQWQCIKIGHFKSHCSVCKRHQ